MKSYKHDTQVGGNHYDQGDLPQHWDLAIMYRWDPFQYQITKYVMRWKDKHDSREQRLTDLKKAKNFLDKYIENFAAYDSVHKPLPLMHEDLKEPPPNLKAHHEDETWQCEGYYGDGTQLYRHRKGRQLYRAKSLQEASEMHLGALNGSSPGPGYVAQG